MPLRQRWLEDQARPQLEELFDGTSLLAPLGVRLGLACVASPVVVDKPG